MENPMEIVGCDEDGAPVFRRAPGVSAARPGICTECGEPLSYCYAADVCQGGKIRSAQAQARSDARIAKRAGQIPIIDCGTWGPS